MYNHYVQFVPKGIAPRETDEIRTVEITLDTTDREEIISEVLQAPRSQTGIDSYAIRNHWEVFQVESEFQNPPWDGFVEMCEKICGFESANDWKSVGRYVYITVDDGKESEVISSINSYFTPLNPRVESSGVVVIDSKPILH